MSSRQMVKFFMSQAQEALKTFEVVERTVGKETSYLVARSSAVTVEVQAGPAYVSGAGPDHLMVIVFAPTTFKASYPIGRSSDLYPNYMCEKFGKRGSDPLNYDGAQVYTTLKAISEITGCKFPLPERIWYVPDEEE